MTPRTARQKLRWAWRRRRKGAKGVRARRQQLLQQELSREALAA